MIRHGRNLAVPGQRLSHLYPNRRRAGAAVERCRLFGLGCVNGKYFGVTHDKRRTGLFGKPASLLGGAQQSLRNLLQIGVF